MADKKEITFKSDLTEVKEKILAGMNIDSSTGTITLNDGVVEGLLPEGQTLQSHLDHQKTMDLIKNAATLAGVEKTTAAMKAAKDLQQTSYNIPTFGKNYLEAEFRRSGTSRAPGSSEVTNYTGCVGYSRHEVVSTRTKAEAIAIKDHFKQMAEEAGL